MYISDTHGKYQEELSNSLSYHHLKYHLHLKIKERYGSTYERLTGKAAETTVGLGLLGRFHSS